jgi:dephospho-CoA kinase
LILGITGRCCAGKDAAARILHERGWLVIDVDRLGHLALEEKADEILAVFGSGASDGHRGIDRGRLGSIVFADTGALKKLERIVHPWMIGEVRRRAADEAESGRNVAVHAAILEKMGLHTLCDAVIFIKAPMPLRLLRAIRRDSLPLCTVLRRFASQRGIDAKRLRKAVDMYSISNVGPLSGLESKLLRIEKRLLMGSSRQE